jgi:hypothetical protein
MVTQDFGILDDSADCRVWLGHQSCRELSPGPFTVKSGVFVSPTENRTVPTFNPKGMEGGSASGLPAFVPLVVAYTPEFHKYRLLGY